MQKWISAASRTEHAEASMPQGRGSAGELLSQAAIRFVGV